MATIRPAEKKDLPTIRELAMQIWPVAYADILSQAQLDYMLEMMYSLPSLEKQFGILQHQFILVSEDENPAGFASFSAHEDSPVYHLHKLYVLPGEQGKHYGQLMVDYVSDRVKIDRGKALQLNVNRNNKAIGFYKKLGFKIIREVDNEIGEGFFMNDFVMEKRF
jgi:ribosomal protein S18 acetylase RimI-like enzyme